MPIIPEDAQQHPIKVSTILSTIISLGVLISAGWALDGRYVLNEAHAQEITQIRTQHKTDMASISKDFQKTLYEERLFDLEMRRDLGQSQPGDDARISRYQRKLQDINKP